MAWRWMRKYFGKSNGERYLFYLWALWSFRGNINSFIIVLINICYYSCHYYFSCSLFSVLNTTWCYWREITVILFSFMLNLCPQILVGIRISFLELHNKLLPRGCLKTKEMWFPHNSGGQESEIKLSSRLIPSGSSRRIIFPCWPPSFWCLLKVLGVSWPVDKSLQSLSPTLHCLLCVSVYPFLSLIRRLPLHLEPTRNQSNLISVFILTHIVIQRHYFQIKPHSEVLSRYEFLENTIRRMQSVRSLRQGCLASS